MNPEGCTEGRGVIYRPYPGAKGEEGMVVRLSSGGGMVFVLFRGDTTAKACRAEDLEPLFGGDQA